MINKTIALDVPWNISKENIESYSVEQFAKSGFLVNCFDIKITRNSVHNYSYPYVVTADLYIKIG